MVDVIIFMIDYLFDGAIVFFVKIIDAVGIGHKAFVVLFIHQVELVSSIHIKNVKIDNCD